MKEWRRKYTRIRCFTPFGDNIPVLLRVRLDDDNDTDGWGIVLDISLGGIGVETRTPVKVGQEVTLSFSLAENFTFVNTKGIVRRVNSDTIYYTCGIEFESVVDREHLQDAISFLGENEQSEGAR